MKPPSNICRKVIPLLVGGVLAIHGVVSGAQGSAPAQARATLQFEPPIVHPGALQLAGIRRAMAEIEVEAPLRARASALLSEAEERVHVWIVSALTDGSSVEGLAGRIEADRQEVEEALRGILGDDAMKRLREQTELVAAQEAFLFRSPMTFLTETGRKADLGFSVGQKRLLRFHLWTLQKEIDTFWTTSDRLRKGNEALGVLLAQERIAQVVGMSRQRLRQMLNQEQRQKWDAWTMQPS